MEKRPTIDDILRLNVIRNRIYNFLKEVEYDQDLHSTMAKQYKEERKKKKHKYKIVNKDNKDNNNKDSNNNINNKQINNENKNDTIKMNQTSEDNNNKTEKVNSNNNNKNINNNNNNQTEKSETKRIESDKNKISAFFKKQKNTPKKKDLPISNNQKQTNISNFDNNQNDKFKETNFLIQKNIPNPNQNSNQNLIKDQKNYKEDEISKKLQEKGYKDLLDEKKGNFNVEKMNEDQYNQLRLLNNLHKDNLEMDSDNDLSVSESVSVNSSTNFKEDNENILIEETNIKEKTEKENKEIKQNKETFKEEKNEMEIIKKEIEKEIGENLVKDVINLLDKYCDKDLVQFDRKLMEDKIKELKNKGYDENKLEKVKDKLDEIFAILMKEKIFI